MIKTIYDFYREAKKTENPYTVVKVEINHSGNITYSCWCNRIGNYVEGPTPEYVIRILQGEEPKLHDIELQERQPELFDVPAQQPEADDTPIAEHYENDFE